MSRLLNRLLGPHRFSTESPWGLMTGICAIFGTVILTLVLMIILGFILNSVVPDEALVCLSSGTIQLAPGCAKWLLGLVGTSSLVFIVSFYAIAHARKGGNADNVLLLRPSGLSWLQYVLVAAVMIIIVLASLNLIAVASGASETDLEVGTEYLKELVAGSGWLSWFLIIGVVGLAGPINEEIIFRGFLFTTLIKTRLGFIGAAVITSALWSMLHYAYPWQVLAGLFIFGVGLSYVVWRTGSLWPAIFAHCANNLMSALILFTKT